MSEDKAKEPGYGRLTAITIENFKGISDPVTVPLRPLTLLFGANSTGKSTVLQALHYAREVLETGNADIDHTEMAGQIMDLGGFCSLVHKHDLDRQIKITLHYEGRLRTEKYLPTTEYNRQGPDGYSTGPRHVLFDPCIYPDEVDIKHHLGRAMSCSVRITSEWSSASNTAFVSNYEVQLDSEDLLNVKYSPSENPTLCVHLGNSIFINCYGASIRDETIEQSIATILEYCSEARLESLELLIERMSNDEFEAFVKEELSRRGISAGGLSENEIRPSERDEASGCLQDEPMQKAPDKGDEFRRLQEEAGTYSIKLNPSKHSAIPLWDRCISFTLPDRAEEFGLDKNDLDPRDYLSREIDWIMSQLLLAPGDTILHELRNLRYLGPIREIPRRGYVPPKYLNIKRWASGLGAWDTLLRSPLPETGGTARTLVERCSAYLKDVLSLGYSIRKVESLPLDVRDPAVQDLLRKEPGITKGSAADLLARLREQLAGLNSESRLQLHDEKSDVDVAPSDIGVGVSQVLPVVVGAADPNCSIFAVEQPELHVHPAVQVALGDVFIRETLGEGSKPRIFLLETHSEHLILRIMRRIRETWSKKLPEGFPKVRPEDVAVLLVEVVDGKTIIREMPLNERGELVKAWPGGFFEEDFEELF